MSFWDTVDQEVVALAHGVHHAATVAAPYIAQAETAVAPETQLPGTVGKVATGAEVGLVAFSDLLSKIDALFAKIGTPPAVVSPTPPAAA